MQSIALTSAERKELIVGMKRERKPSRRLRMHIVLLASDGHRPARIARALYWFAHHRLRGCAYRFVREGRAAFEDRGRRGPRPLLHRSACERIEALVEEQRPIAYGWLRSRWSCSLLMLQLFRERALLVGRETIRRALHRREFRWRRPRPVAPPKEIPKRSKRGSKRS
jgi:transposase